MSTSMRLKRFGTKKRPYYRIVIMDKKLSTSSKTIDEIGTFCPIEAQNQVKVDAEKAKSWIAKGAVVSPTVKNLLNAQGISLSRTQD